MSLIVQEGKKPWKPDAVKSFPWLKRTPSLLKKFAGNML
jgi:hypothetical protein